MALAQVSSFPEDDKVRGRKESENRQNSLATAHPPIESLMIFGGLASPNGTLMIVADGKQKFYTINRRQLFSFAEQVYGAMKNMEPGK